VWNNSRSVEQFCGTFFSAWNISVEHFGRRGTTGPGPVTATYLQPGAIYYIAKKPHYIVYCIVRLVYYIVLANFFSIASCIWDGMKQEKYFSSLDPFQSHIEQSWLSPSSSTEKSHMAQDLPSGLMRGSMPRPFVICCIVTPAIVPVLYDILIIVGLIFICRTCGFRL